MSDESPSESPVSSNMPAEEPQFKAHKKLVRIRLPNNSYRTMPVATTTTVGSVVEKLASKLMLQNPDSDFSECRLFLVLGGHEEVQLDEQDFLGDILNLTAQSGDELTYKKAGEKFVDREEQLKQIEQQNRQQALRKETVHEAMAQWMGGDEASPSPLTPEIPNPLIHNFGFLLSERKHFLPVLYGRYRTPDDPSPSRLLATPPEPSSVSDKKPLNTSCPQLVSPRQPVDPSSSGSANEVLVTQTHDATQTGDAPEEEWQVQTSHLLPFFAMASSLSSLLLEKEATQRANKKSKAGGRSMFVDFASPPTATQKREVIPCSKGTEIVVSLVMMNGWKCILKEFLCHPNDSATIGKAALEVALLEALPSHPNLVRYLYHDHPAPGQTRLYLSYFGRSLASQLPQWGSHVLSLDLIIRLLLPLCSGLIFIHEYCLIHGNLHDGCVYVILDEIHAPSPCLQQVVLGDLMEAFQTNDLGCDIKQQRVTRTITKPWFAAPELLQSTELQFNHLVDVFSVGMIGLSLLSHAGRIPCPPDASDLSTSALLEARSDWLRSLLQAPEYSALHVSEKHLLHILLACTSDPSTRPNILQLQEILWNNRTGTTTCSNI